MKEAVSIPVIGNGDILTADDVIRMQDETNCDGFMIARGAEGNPWIFKQILHYFETGEKLEKPSFAEVTDMILRHAQMQIGFKGSTPESVRCANMRHGTPQVIKIPPPPRKNLRSGKL